MTPVLIPITEAAELLSVCPKTVRQMCVSGIIPARRFGKIWRIHRELFLEWIDKSYGKKGGLKR